MTEVNERWQRDNRMARRWTMAGMALAPVLWAASYAASLPAGGETFHSIWHGIVSLATLAGAVGVTIGTLLGVGIVLTDEPPLPGSNY